ncbi:MAG: transposase, partial [Traorella sp.]
VQLSLPMDLSIIIDESDPVVSFVEAMKEVNLSKYVKPITSNNTHSHDRGMLLKVVLFAYQENKRSLDDMVHLCRTDIRYIWLSNEERPSKMSFQRLLSSLNDMIDNIFFDINKQMIGNISVNTDIQFIDGTKIEANANKNSFVYKKRILNSKRKNFIHTTGRKMKKDTRYARMGEYLMYMSKTGISNVDPNYK